MRTFKYQMTLRGGEGLLKSSDCRHMGDYGRIVKFFIVAEKVKFTVPLALFTVYWGRELAKNIIIPLYGRTVLLKKRLYDVLTFTI